MEKLNNNIKIVLIFISLLSLNIVYSQKSWTLDECIDYAIENNLQLNDFEYNTKASNETRKQAFRDLLPSIQGVTDYNVRFGRSVDPNDNSISNTDFFTNTYALEASLDVFQGFQKQNAIKASAFLYKAAKEETLQQKYLLAFRVMQAFYDIQFFEGAVTIAQEQEKISQTNFDFVKKQEELGLKAGADVNEAESLLLNDKLSVTQASNDLIAAKLKLMQEMNLRGVSDITITTTIKEETNALESSEIQSEAIFDKAKEFLPIIKAGELKIEGAKKQLAVERGKLYPSLSVFGQYGSGYFETIIDASGNTVPFRQQFSDNTYQVIGFSLSVPILDGWSGRSRVKQQKITQMRVQNDLEIQKQELFQTIQDLVQQHEALERELKQSDKNMEAQNVAFAIAQKRYEKGLINTIELFTAKNQLAMAQNQNLQVRLRTEVNNSMLEFYSGLPVFNINNQEN